MTASVFNRSVPDPVAAFLNSMCLGNHENTPINRSEAEYNIHCWQEFGIDIPVEMTAEQYLTYWNYVICSRNLSEALPVVFINCSSVPFIDGIIQLQKLFETRTRNTLKALIGRRVYLAETGKGKPVCRCTAIIGQPIRTDSREEWEQYFDKLGIPAGSKYDWQDSTKVKYLYPLSDVQACEPFRPAEGYRHGRVWMEYAGKAD